MRCLRCSKLISRNALARAAHDRSHDGRTRLVKAPAPPAPRPLLVRGSADPTVPALSHPDVGHCPRCGTHAPYEPGAVCRAPRCEELSSESPHDADRCAVCRKACGLDR